MIGKIFIAIFIFIALFSAVVLAILSYHFKKFKMPFDPIAKKALKGYFFTEIFLLILSFIFLIFIIK